VFGGVEFFKSPSVGEIVVNRTEVFGGIVLVQHGL